MEGGGGVDAGADCFVLRLVCYLSWFVCSRSVSLAGYVL